MLRYTFLFVIFLACVCGLLVGNQISHILTMRGTLRLVCFCSMCLFCFVCCQLHNTFQPANDNNVGCQCVRLIATRTLGIRKSSESHWITRFLVIS